MPRSFRTGTPLPIDSEIERTAKKLRKQAKLRKRQPISGTSSSSTPPVINIWEDILLSSVSASEIESPSLSPQPTSTINTTPPSSHVHNILNTSSTETSPTSQAMTDNPGGNQGPPNPPPEQTLCQWSRQEVTQQPLCITYPAATNLELKSGLIHLLPTFRGLENEDHHKFLTKFHVVCVGMKPHNVTEEQIKLRAFPFTVQDAAKDWIYDLPPGTVTTWVDLARLFLDKYFLEMKASALQREIIGIKRHKREAFHTYWERFKKLYARCPKHGITEYQLFQYFNEGMNPMERRLLNASSGGSLPDNTPTEIRNLIKNIAEDSKHSSRDEEWYTDAPQGVKEVQTPQIEAQLYELTKVVMMLAKDKCVQPTPRPCGICTQVGHPTDMCPQLQVEDYEEAKAMGGLLGSNQRGYEQPRGDQRWSNNQGWGGHQQANYQPSQPHQYQQRPPFPPQNFQPRQPQHPPQQSGSSSMSLEYIVKSLATSTQTFQQETKASIKNLEKQVSQLATSVSKLESQGKLLAQTETNPRHNVCAITLRGGKSYDGPKVSVDQKEEEIVVEEATKEQKKEEKTIKKKPFIIESKATPALFPERLKSTKKEREESEIMQIFKRVQINISFLEAIKQVPRYARLLKDLCLSKKKLKGNQVVTVREHVSAVLQKRMPPKCKDPGVFTVPCKLGNLHVPRPMLDLGASVNVLPYSLFKSIGVGTLSKTGVIIQLADRSLVHPKGVLEDVLVQVDEFIFPADFYVLDMGDDNSPSSSSILLGRPFLKTSKTKIDVYNGTLSMEFDGQVINFNVHEEKKVPSELQSVNLMNLIEPSTKKGLSLSNSEFLELVLQGKLDRDKAKELAKEVDMDNEVLESLEFIDDKKCEE
ncbi:uncharacterized protein LOC111914567 [Lactuca sativa]|uniref:uncharacterized protein LOC111914567 n=1 Tax=Lactuca sativa TaxID=4236 RepID=UPI0022AE856A|nr:uncharacterized protein LOC111914567 [Lactuca sativa]